MNHRILAPRRLFTPAKAMGVGIVAVVVVAAGCSSESEPTTSASVQTGNAAEESSSQNTSPIIFSGEGNNLDAYSLPSKANPENSDRAGAEHQRVVTNFADDSNGLDINAQLCVFELDGKRMLIAGEDTNQPDPPAGWGIFELIGDEVGELSVNEVAKLTPTFQPPADPENYGCAVLADGRILTTDVGESATGASGQLIIWFPPLDGFNEGEIAYCKLDIALPTGQSLLATGDEEFLVAAARGGVYRFTGPLPTSASEEGGCDGVDSLGSPMATKVQKETLIEPGADGMATPTGLATSPNDGIYVSSVFTGVINEYNSDGIFRRSILAPPAGETIGDEPYTTGTPLGIATDSDGNLWYADIGLVIDDDGIGPGQDTGTLRVIRFDDGTPQEPELVADGLAFPDGVGAFTP